MRVEITVRVWKDNGAVASTTSHENDGLEEAEGYALRDHLIAENLESYARFQKAWEASKAGKPQDGK